MPLGYNLNSELTHEFWNKIMYVKCDTGNIYSSEMGEVS